MRFDLTNASFRVLQRAEQLRLQRGISSVSAAKVLLSLFGEEESRAADWLSELDLSAEKFRAAFGLAVLQSPISAPGFPMGSYGVLPGEHQQFTSRTGQAIETTSANNNSPVIGQPGPDQMPEESDNSSSETAAPPQEPDDWVSTPQPRYSLYVSNPMSAGQNTLRFYLDDTPVHAGRFTPELESTLELIALRFAKTERRRETITLANGGAKTIADGMLQFTLATEHLLLAAILDEGDVGRWLQDNGFDPAEVYQRISNLTAETNVETNTKITEISETTLPPEIAKQKPAAHFEKKETAPTEQVAVWRLLDAVANRGREAVRVLEDYVRFIQDDADLTRQHKEFRHEFQQTLNAFSMPERLSARDTETDVGTAIETETEYERQTLNDILSANFSRLQESLRTLEEFAKLMQPDAAKRFEQLRYRSYTLQKHTNVAADDSANQSVKSVDVAANRANTEINGERISRFPASAMLYALVDAGSDEAAFADHIQQLIDGGVNVIQLRDKHASDRTILSRSRLLKELLANTGVLSVMNDRPDLAVLAGADGVHVGQDELTLQDVRAIVGTEMFVGVSTHNIEQVRLALADGADYIGVGPVFVSQTKDFDESELKGIDFLQEVAAEITTLPVFAIGGITLENVADVLETGISRIAVSSALNQTDNARNTAEEFVCKIAGWRANRN